MSTQSENSLMKKTKKELVDIILRKDDVEAKLRKELNDVNLDFSKDFSKAKDMISKKENTIVELNNSIKEKNQQVENFKDTIDDLVAENYTYRHHQKFFIGITIASVVIAIGAIIFGVIF